jgi:hypothetical protein
VDPITILGRHPAEPLREQRLVAAKAEAERIVNVAVGKATGCGLAAKGQVELGEPAAKIVSHATKINADTIVMGTHGRSGFRRLFMGSVAEAVLRSSPCPVVIIREKAGLEHMAAPVQSPEPDTPVFALRLVEVASEDFERLYGEIATFMNGPGGELPGIVDAQLFGSTDRTRIVILAQFRSHQDWVRAQWDARLGELLEEIAANSETLEFSLYRGDRFSVIAPACP